MQVATTTPQTHLGGDMAKVLIVVALRTASLSSIPFYLVDNKVQAIQL
jgi:hypothetical protein